MHPADEARLGREVSDLAEALGLRIRMARQRRKMRVQDLAHQAGVSRKTMQAIERGAVTTSLGAYLAVLACLSLTAEVRRIADPALDPQRTLPEQEARSRRVRLPRA